MSRKYPCPCCGYLTFGQPPGSYNLCPICDWEDDLVQLAFPDYPGGANQYSLIEGQRRFAQMQDAGLPVAYGRLPCAGDVRDNTWRPLNVTTDRYLHWERADDRALWTTVGIGDICLYYWRPQYWLISRP